jgi:hypothetical protein
MIGRSAGLLMHAWELGNASFDYFFFKENCSYHLLSLLEYADPRCTSPNDSVSGLFRPTRFERLPQSRAS